MAHEIAGTARCKLCQAGIVGPAALQLGTGHSNAQNNRIEAFLKKIVHHLETEHPQENRYLALQAGEFLGVLRLQQFKLADAGLAEQMDFLRWRVHTGTLRERIPDEKLSAMAAHFAGELMDLAVSNFQVTGYAVESIRPKIKDAIQAKLAELLRGVRDLYEEPGKYKYSLTPDPASTPPQKVQI